MKRLALGALVACGGSDPKPAPMPAPPIVPDAAAPDARDDDLPGSYAVLVISDLDGSHNGQHYSHYARATAAVELADDGGVTLCFGHESTDDIDSDDFDKHTRFHDQHGYRGTYAIDGDAAKITAALDETVCETITDIHAPPATVALTCARDTVEGHLALVCDPDRDEHEFYALTIPEVLSGSRFVLGPGAGLSLRIQGKPPEGYFGGQKRRYEIRRGLEPIEQLGPEP